MTLLWGLGLPALCQTFTNPVRVATPVDPDSMISGDLNGDGRVDLIWFQVTTTGSIGHILIAQAGGSYVAGQTFSIPGALTAVPACATADVTRDGKLDLICATLYGSTYSTTVLVFPGNGDGTLAAPISTQFNNQNGQAIILTAVGDLNGDGVPDFILQDVYYTPATVLLSNGSGGFLPAKNLPNSYNYDVPVAADINGDGIPDILWPNGAAVALGKGDGSFASLLSPYPIGSGPVTCAFHDLDGDGKLDAACGYLSSNLYGTALDILHGNGDGTFNPTPIAHITFGSTSISNSGVGDFLQPVGIRDVNGDGIPDILATAGDGLTVLLGEPGLTFRAPSHYALAYSGYAPDGFYPEQRQYADLNGDGLLDVLAAGPNGLYLLFGHADGSFGSAITTKIDEVNGQFAVADFNGDGKPDIVSTGAPQTSLSFGIGDGTFATPVPVPGSPFGSGAYIYAADFDGDGKPDLLSYDASYAYSLMLGHGDGTFAPAIATSGLAAALRQVSLTGDDTVPYVLTADLNSDGKADLFVISTNSQSSTYSLVSALSAGDGSFHSVSTSYTAPPYIAGTFYYTPVAPALGDFAHSGHLDAAYYLNENIYIVRGNGDGSFNTTPSVLATPTVAGVSADSYQALQTADMDGDGNLDLVFLSWFQAGPFFYQGGPSCVFIYYGKGDGTFTSPVQAGCFTHAYTDMRVADVNGDGLRDLVLQTASGLNNYVVGVVDNLGGRSFGPELNYTAGSLSGGLFVADLNLDGRPDLVFGNQLSANGYSANSVTVLLNTTGNAATGALTSSPNPSYVGEPFNITATLTPPTAGTVYAGNISFFVDGNPIGSVPLSGNAATIAGPTTLSAGTHQLSATWPGDANDPSLTLNATQNVLLYPLQLSLACSPNPSLLGETVTLATQFTATPPPGLPASGVPYTGTLSFYDGTTLLEQQQVATAGDSFSTTTLSAGTHPLSASYTGDSIYAATTASCSQVVDKLPTTSQLSLNPVPYAGEAFQLVAKVVPVSPTTYTPTGSVNFTIDGTSVGIGTVDPTTGIATFNDPGISGGNHLLACTYGGDTDFSGSACPVNSLGVAPAVDTLTLNSSSNPAPAGAPILFTANLSGNNKAAPGNTITFTINSSGMVQLVGTATTDTNGNAVYASPGLAPGTYSVSAFFAGTADLQSTSSRTLVQVVVINPTSTMLSASPNPGYAGQTITLTATVTATGTPTATAPVASGTVTFLDGSTVLGSAVLNANGVATYPTTAFGVGMHSLTASYPTGTDFTGSVSSPFLETILPSTFTITLSPSTITLSPGASGSVAVQLTSVGSFSGPLALSYGALPANATASINASTVTLSAGGTGSSTLSLNTLLRASNRVPARPGPSGFPTVFTALVLLFVPVAVSRRKKLTQRLGIVMMFIALQGITGCTNVYYTASFVAAGSYQVPVTAVDTNHNSQTATLTVIVTP